MTPLLPFRWHIAEVLVIVAAAVAHHVVVVSPHRRRLVIAALAALLVVTVWPIGDLAASVSLTVATIQRLVIMLFVAPLLILATPTEVLSRLTRPRLVDTVTKWLAHPGVAIAIVTVVGTLTLSVPVVDAGAHSWLVRDVTLVVVLVIGWILWTPALALMPGAKRLSRAARGGYLMGSSLVVTSLSIVWIFSQHPLYPALHGQETLVHMSPLLDQQMAGFVAKLGCYIPMWIIAFSMFFNADEVGTPVEDTTLHWADVERQLLRVDRERERSLRRHRPQ